jgi:hypothetical protein
MTTDELLRSAIKVLARRGPSPALTKARAALFWFKVSQLPAAAHFERLQRMRRKGQL